jgi:hypothetical protein
MLARGVSILIGFCNRLAYALLFGIGTWVFAWLPTPLAANQEFGLLLSVINAPVAFVSLFLPFQWQAVDLVFGRNLPHSLGEAAYLWQHLRTAVPVYLILFYLPLMLANARKYLDRAKEVRRASRQ